MLLETIKSLVTRSKRRKASDTETQPVLDPIRKSEPSADPHTAPVTGAGDTWTGAFTGKTPDPNATPPYEGQCAVKQLEPFIYDVQRNKLRQPCRFQDSSHTVRAIS